MSNITCGLGENGTIIDCGTTAKPVEDIDGYAIPVTGLSNGTFYTIHVPALICIVVIATKVQLLTTVYQDEYIDSDNVYHQILGGYEFSQYKCIKSTKRFRSW
jgi:hypothetical protein